MSTTHCKHCGNAREQHGIGALRCPTGPTTYEPPGQDVIADALRVARVEGQQLAARALRRVLSQEPRLNPTALRTTLETLADELDGP